MNALIQITGVQYACPEGDVCAVMAEMERTNPEVLLVTQHTQDFGMIVRAVVGTDYRGVVSRFDVELVLALMHHNKTSVLVGHIANIDAEGLCYTVSIEEEGPAPADTSLPSEEQMWEEWQWNGAPLMAERPEESRLAISIKVALKELEHSGCISMKTLEQHLGVILEHARWDVSDETQRQLCKICRLVEHNDCRHIRQLSRGLKRTLNAFGSAGRTKSFAATYLPELVQSNEAELMYRQWKAMLHDALADPARWETTLREALLDIDHALDSLPAGLLHQKNDFGALMHRLLYLNVPKRKLQMLLSAIVLRTKIRKALALPCDENDGEREARQLDVARRLAPIFNEDVLLAREFLYAIEGKTGREITHLVCRWTMNKRIRRELCHRPLWSVLHESGLYTHTETNWNMQVR